MSLHDAAWAIREAMKVRGSGGHDYRGCIGDVLEETLRHAEGLLDIADEEMVGGEDLCQVMMAAAPMLRANLRVLRDRIA